MDSWFEWKYAAVPLIAALIGWLTNWVAIKMLFLPKKPINLGLFVLHGIFHRRQKEIAHKLGEMIEQKLFSHDDIHNVITSDDFLNTILPIVESYLDEFISERLRSIHPMLSMLPDSMINLFKEKLLEEFQHMVPKVMDGASDTLEEHLNVKEVIRTKIEEFEVDELEAILFSIMKSEFKMIEYLGGVLGFFIGISQILIMVFL